MPIRWAGIDEAGYGPNLGPLVMTCVVAESSDESPLDFWNDLGGLVSRAGGNPSSLWVDDSKAIYQGGTGLDRLEATTSALLTTIHGSAPTTLRALLETLRAGDFDEAELAAWLVEPEPSWPRAFSSGTLSPRLVGPPWKLTAVRSVVIGPARFNRLIGQGERRSKALAHQHAFMRLLEPLWEADDLVLETRVRSDKHGGRHFYHPLLAEIFPGVWIDRGLESPDLSHYTVRGENRRLEVRFEPRADASDGLVALASIVSKTVREAWMEVFNAYWTGQIPGLRPTAGYPTDARRFRAAIEDQCRTRGLDPEIWWRAR
jgi:hypothetical protein